ncbi:MAG: hypothetical protein JF601_11945 [Acidobacteria bacterium]|nr:hypothetical protein [Acidobacteriota bacterium]
MLLAFCQWVSTTAVGQAINMSSWAFAVIESVHLLALAVIGGAVLMLDLRLLGLGLRDQPIARIARDAQPWLTGSLIVMLFTGVLLFSSEPIKCYNSTPFRVKMSSLVLAMIFAFTVRRKVALAGDGQVPVVWLKIVAIVSLVLWLGVGASGRWIGFSA